MGASPCPPLPFEGTQLLAHALRTNRGGAVTQHTCPRTPELGGVINNRSAANHRGLVPHARPRRTSRRAGKGFEGFQHGFQNDAALSLPAAASETRRASGRGFNADELRGWETTRFN